jgi:nucleotide-binding universal stress UspA family protein
MSLRSLCLGLVVEETTISEKALSYVASLASRSAAHLTVKIGVPEFAPMGNLMLPEIGGMVAEANANRRGRADALARKLEAMLSTTGVSPDIEVIQEAYYVARDRILRACRVSDLAVVTRSERISGLERDLTEELLFSSGRPLLLVPPNAPDQAALDIVSLAWDGGERAARAAGDAAALLPPSATVEVVCVAGDRDNKKQVAGWDICRNLARHFSTATVAAIEAGEGGVSAAILSQANSSGASLLVMGGYGHSRLRQVVLGGVTHDMVTTAPLPVLLSY